SSRRASGVCLPEPTPARATTPAFYSRPSRRRRSRTKVGSHEVPSKGGARRLGRRERRSLRTATQGLSPRGDRMVRPLALGHGLAHAAGLLRTSVAAVERAP